MNVRPLQRGMMLPDLLWNRNALASECRLGPLKVARIPDGNGVDHQRERRGLVELRFIAPVVKATLSAKGDVTRQRVQVLPFIESDQHPPSKHWIIDVFQNVERLRNTP